MFSGSSDAETSWSQEVLCYFVEVSWKENVQKSCCFFLNFWSKTKQIRCIDVQKSYDTYKVCRPVRVSRLPGCMVSISLLVRSLKEKSNNHTHNHIIITIIN